MAPLLHRAPRLSAIPRAAVKRAAVLIAQAASCLLVPAAVRSQTTSAPQTPKFEVASIRQVPEDRFPRLFYMSPPGSDQFTVRNENLTALLSWAYGLIDPRQLPHAPGWFITTRWDITAKPDGTVAPNEETMKLLVQQLLRDRFHLKYRTRTEVVKGYRLVTAKDGAKLTATKGGSRNVSALLSGPNARIGVRNSPMSGLADALTNVLHEPVVDGTNLTGTYDISFRFAPLQDTESTALSIFSALGELGLKLEKADVPLQVLQIDNIDRFPTEN